MTIPLGASIAPPISSLASSDPFPYYHIARLFNTQQGCFLQENAPNFLTYYEPHVESDPDYIPNCILLFTPVTLISLELDIPKGYPLLLQPCSNLWFFYKNA